MRLHEHCKTPAEAEHSNTWTASGFSEEYRRMGHWRLTFQMEFAYSLGYKYIMQTDDDSAFLQPVQESLLRHMEDNRLLMAARTVLPSDPQEVTLGLAEIVKLFLVTERLEPANLFADSCQPTNMSGLYTPDIGGPPDGGYQASYLYGDIVRFLVSGAGSTLRPTCVENRSSF